MKRILNFGMVALLIMVSSACNKCRKLDCKNDASCEKRVGVCNCSYLYSGELCEDETRKNYVGTYDGNITYPNPSNPFQSESTELTVNVFIQGSDAHGLGVNFTFLGSKYELTGKLTGEGTFTFDAQNMSVDGFGDITILETSTGTFAGNALNSTINIRLQDVPQFPISLTFAGSK